MWTHTLSSRSCILTHKPSWMMNLVSKKQIISAQNKKRNNIPSPPSSNARRALPSLYLSLFQEGVPILQEVLKTPVGQPNPPESQWRTAEIWWESTMLRYRQTKPEGVSNHGTSVEYSRWHRPVDRYIFSAQHWMQRIWKDLESDIVVLYHQWNGRDRIPALNKVSLGLTLVKVCAHNQDPTSPLGDASGIHCKRILVAGQRKSMRIHKESKMNVYLTPAGMYKGGWPFFAGRTIDVLEYLRYENQLQNRSNSWVLTKPTWNWRVLRGKGEEFLDWTS